MKVCENINDTMAAWLVRQPMFFVATAPLAGDGHVNLSPKGMGGTFAVLGPLQVAYLDYYGSGSETIAHLRENGRITVMVPAFDGRPNIVRLYGRGRFVLATEPGFDELRARFPKAETAGQRAVIVIDLDRVQESCGYAVPTMSVVAERNVLDLHHAKKDPDSFDAYAVAKNAESIDGLPSVGELIGQRRSSVAGSSTPS